jgi:hypothetical protein
MRLSWWSCPWVRLSGRWAISERFLIITWGIDYEIMSAQNIHGQSNVNTHHCVISFGPILELIAIGARGGFWNTRNRITSVSYHDFERSESKLPYMCPGYSNHMYNQQWGRIAHNVTITELSEYISYIMNPGSEKDYRAHNITTFVLSAAWMASTDTDRGRGLPSFLANANSGQCYGPGVLVWWVEIIVITSLHRLVSSQSILCVCQSGAEIVDLPLSDKQAVAQVQRKTHTMRHCSSEDL